MIPIRCLSAFLSRIFLILILLFTTVFLLINLTKHLSKETTRTFIPVEKHFNAHRYDLPHRVRLIDLYPLDWNSEVFLGTCEGD